MSEAQVEVPGFRILRELGRGASGVVYQAQELALGRDVALKVLKVGVAHSPEVRARFEREVRAAARVRHPNIVPVLATGETAGRLWYTMELVDGPSLDRVLAESATGRLPAARAARIVLETARVLAAAHAAGVTHRDVKPANVVLLRESAPALESSSTGRRLRASWLREDRRERGEAFVDRPRLMDFGLAADAAEVRLSESGMLIGTPGYMAPEQFRGRTGEVGPAADQWALGVMLYELLTGRLPFPAEDIPTLARLVAEEAPVAPSRLDPRLDAELETICLKCLEISPRDRYASCDALVADLERWLREEPIAARPPGTLRRLKAWARRRPRTVTALAALALVLVAGGAAALRWRVKLSAQLSDLSARAQQAEGRGAWGEAEALHDERLALDPADERVREARDQARGVQQALAAERAFDEALAAVARVREGEHEVEALERQAALGARTPGGSGLGLSEARGSEPWWMREPAWNARVRAEGRGSQLVRERAEVDGALAVALAAAEAAAPRAGAQGARVLARLRAGAARWHLDSWRRAEALGDADQAAVHRLAVERLDPEPHRQELEGAGTVVLAPADRPLSAWLFCCLREGDLLPRGGPRWIPIPWPTGRGAARRPLPRVYDAILARRLANEGLRAVAPDVPAPAGAAADDALHVATVEGPLRRARYAALKEGSAYPLELSDGNRLAWTTEEQRLTLAPGHYLLWVERPGCLPGRLPFELPRRGMLRLEPAAARETDALPEGFVAVSAGPAGGHGPEGSEPVGTFLAERFEISFAQWWEFLDDPRTRAEIESHREQGWRFVPRSSDGPLSLPGADGRFEPVLNPARPVSHVSIFDLAGYPEPPSGEPEPLDGQMAELADALARSETVGWGYLRWRSLRSRERAAAAMAEGPLPPDVLRLSDAHGRRTPHALLFTLPTETEWLRMASGGQRRAFPFGDELDWGLLKGGRSRRANAAPEPVGLFPDDESPFGVRDLAGSVAEWTATWSEKGNTFALRGGSWASMEALELSLSARRLERPRAALPSLGVRVIVRATQSVP